MNEPQVSVQLENRRQCFQPGEVLRGEFHIQTLQPDQIKAIELSVIWLTEGKGDEDVGLHYFKRYSPDEQRLDTRSCVAFESAEPLPPSPLSYDGRIVKSGAKELALELEKKGYDWIKDEAAAAP